MENELARDDKLAAKIKLSELVSFFNFNNVELKEFFLYDSSRGIGYDFNLDKLSKKQKETLTFSLEELHDLICNFDIVKSGELFNESCYVAAYQLSERKYLICSESSPCYIFECDTFSKLQIELENRLENDIFEYEKGNL